MSKTFPSTASSETGDSRKIRGVNAASGRQFSSTRSTFSRGHTAIDSLSRLIYKCNTYRWPATATAEKWHTVKLLINANKLLINVYLNTDLKTPAFNRDPAFIGDPASIRTWASSTLRLLMSVVPISLVYVNFTLRMLILSGYIYLVSQKTRNICVSTKFWE